MVVITVITKKAIDNAINKSKLKKIQHIEEESQIELTEERDKEENTN